jgi:hypothetical protein
MDDIDDMDHDIPGVHPELIDNDDIFSPKLWEILVAPVAALIPHCRRMDRRRLNSSPMRAVAAHSVPALQGLRRLRD